MAILGAGLGGLSAAYALRQRGLGCTVFEASSRCGGAIHSVSRDGFVFELGPNTMLDRHGVLSRLIHELGLQDERLYASTTSNRRFIVRHGTPMALPQSLADFRRTPLFSTGAKLRLLAEPLITPRREPDIDESLYNFLSRRLGQEIVDYALDPFLAGTYAGKPEQLSSSYVLKRLKDFEDATGSLFRGALSAARAPKPSAQGAKHYASKTSTLVGFQRGAETLIDALKAKIGEQHVVTNAAVTRLERARAGAPWRVTTRQGEHAEDEFDAVLLALPAHAIAEIEIIDASRPLDLSPFGLITHPPVAILALGYRREQIDHALDGFGMLIPSREPFEHLGCVFASSIFSGRAPRGHVQLVAFFGGARSPHNALLEPKAQLALLQRELHALIGLRGEPVCVERRLWPKAIPQYEVGYERVLAPILALEAAHPSLAFTGTWRQGISVPDVILDAERAAHSIALGAHPSSRARRDAPFVFSPSKLSGKAP